MAKADDRQPNVAGKLAIVNGQSLGIVERLTDAKPLRTQAMLIYAALPENQKAVAILRAERLLEKQRI